MRFLRLNRLYSLFFLLVCFCSLSVKTQNKLNLLIRNELAQSPPSALLQFMVKGDIAILKKSIKEYGAIIDWQSKAYAAIRIPAHKAEKFSRQKAVTYITRSIGKMLPLNDTVLKQNRATQVHQGVHPLPFAYEGQDVVIGIVDLALEEKHPDFLNPDGSTRIKYYWHQGISSGTAPQPYGYGTEWNSTQIDNGEVIHNSSSDHGTHVAGIAVGNGRATGNFKGMAPKADIIFVDYAGALSGRDFQFTADQAIEYIFGKADELGKPCVVNLSIGTYYGAHDGKDVHAKFVDSLVAAKPGRAIVCAAGNSRELDPYHLSYTVTTDTNFTWFEYDINSGAGFSGVFFEVWADTADFENVYFSLGMDQVSPSYSLRGQTAFRRVQLGDAFDTIYNSTGVPLANIQTYTELTEGRYFMQLAVMNIDSTDYHIRFSTTGTGSFDVWSGKGVIGTSNMVSTQREVLPTVAVFPDIQYYKEPDLKSTLVTGWACANNTITVGNYTSKNAYYDVNGGLVTFPDVPNDIFKNSSIGPTRDGRIKPDIAAPGGIVLSASRLENLAIEKIAAPAFIAQGGMHKRNSGTSMAAPSVSGAIALFFEHCPNATIEEVKQALGLTARADSFTGVLPNIYWGDGKLDAFNLMKYASDNALQQVNVLGNRSFCDGGSVSLSSDTVYSSYTWSNNVESPGIVATQIGNYWFNAVDDKGCNLYSDTILVIANASPPVPTIQKQGQYLRATLSHHYQWYYEGTPLQDSITSSIKASQPGTYMVESFHINGCSTFSEPYIFEFMPTSMYSLGHSIPFNVFPNPTSERFIISYSNEVSHVELYNISGQIVDEAMYTYNKGGLVWLSSIPSGSYMLRVYFSNGLIGYSKLLIQH